MAMNSPTKIINVTALIAKIFRWKLTIFDQHNNA